MKKIMIVANSYKTIYNFRIELIQKLIEFNHKVILVIPKDKNNFLFNNFPIKIIEVSLSRFSLNPLKEFLLFFNYLKIIDAHHPDTLFSFTIKPNVYIGIIKSVFKRNFKFIPTITGLGKSFQNQLSSFFFIYLYKLALHKAFKIIFQNKSNLNFFLSKNLINSGNYELVNGSGVNLKRYSYNVPNNRSFPKFLMVSRLRKDKGIDEYFRLVKSMSQSHPTVVFGLAGWIEDKKYTKTLNSFISCNNFTYFGELTQEEIKLKIIDSDCIIHPSYHEGMSNVILEASALGRPAIASDIPGCNDIIQDGKNGLLFKAKDYEDFFSKVISYLELSPTQTSLMSLNAYKTVKEKFNREHVIDAYVNCV